MGIRPSFAALALLIFATPIPAVAQDEAQDALTDLEEAAAFADRTSMIVPGIEAYRFADAGDQPAIWLDVVWVGRELDKRAMEVRGDLLFYDLAGRLHFGLAVDLQRPISRNDAVTQTGIGIAYDASRSDHQWMRNTPTSNMRIDFRVERVLYEDGELVEF